MAVAGSIAAPAIGIDESDSDKGRQERGREYVLSRCMVISSHVSKWLAPPGWRSRTRSSRRR